MKEAVFKSPLGLDEYNYQSQLQILAGEEGAFVKFSFTSLTGVLTKF